MKLKRFNEEHSNELEPIVIDPKQFDMETARIFSKYQNSNFKPYYYDENLKEMVEIKLKEHNNWLQPYTEKEILKGPRVGKIAKKVITAIDGNPFGLIYLIDEENMNRIAPVIKKVSDVLKKMEEQKSNVLALIGSYLVHK